MQKLEVRLRRDGTVQGAVKGIEETLTRKRKRKELGSGLRMCIYTGSPEKLSGRLLAIAKQAAPDACLQA
jgi:hypothetical protein